MQNNEFTVNILNADQLYVEGKRIQQLDLGTLVSSDTGNGYGIGIKTDKPRVTFDISGTDGLRIPFGNTSSRPQNIRFTGTAGESTDYKGVIRYNTETEKYESWLGTNAQTSWGRFVIEDEDYYTTDISSNILIRGNHTIWGINGDENNSSGNLTLRAGGTIDKQGQVNYIGTNISNADKSSKITLTGGNSTNISLTTANQDRMIIDSNGKIGIGVTSPVHNVDISVDQSMVTHNTSVQSKVITNSAFDSKNITNNNMYLMLQHGTGNSSGGIFSGIARSNMGGFSLGVKYNNSIKNIINANSEGFMNINVGQNIHDDKLFLAPYVFGFNPALTTSKFVRLDNNKSNNSNLFISNMEFTTSTQQTNFGKNGVFIGKGCTLYSDTTNNPELLIFGDNPISNGGVTPQSNGGGILLSDKMRFVTYKYDSFVADSGITSHLGQAISHSKKLQLNSVTRMVIDKDGKVGIGTDNPGSKLTFETIPSNPDTFSWTNGGNTTSAVSGIDVSPRDSKFVGNGISWKSKYQSWGANDLSEGSSDNVARIFYQPVTFHSIHSYSESNQTGIGLYRSGRLVFTCGDNENEGKYARMVLNSRGNIGIGTDNPLKKIHVKDGRIRIEGGTNFDKSGVLELTNDAGTTSYIFSERSDTNLAGNLFIRSNLNTILDSENINGKVGIGTNDPREKLDINGALHIRGTFATTYNNDTNNLSHYTNTYLSFAPLGSDNDWAYLRQIGGSNLIHMVLDFHDDDNDARFSIRNVQSTANPHIVKTRFTVMQDQVGIGTGSLQSYSTLDVVGADSTGWSGRITAGRQSGARFVAGTYNGVAYVGAHNITSTTAETWTNLLINPGSGNVGIGLNGTPQARLDVGDTSLFRGEMKWRYQNSSGHASHALYGDNLDWYIRSGSESGKVIIQDTGGNVGIGTSSPNSSYKLDVKGHIRSNQGIRISGEAAFGHDGVLNIFYPSTTYGNETVVLQTTIDGINRFDHSTSVDDAGDDDRKLLCLQAYSGRVCINTTSANSSLNIGGGGTGANGRIQIHTANGGVNGDGIAIKSTGDHHMINFVNSSGSTRGQIRMGGSQSQTTISYENNSDRRLKKDIVDMVDMIDKILELKPRNYRWRENNVYDYGFIAQEVHDVFPHLRPDISYYQKNENCCKDLHCPTQDCYCYDSSGNCMLKEETKPYYYGLDYGKFTPYLTKALQEVIIIQREEKGKLEEANQKIVELEDKNQQLEAKNQELESKLNNLIQVLEQKNVI